MRAILELDLQWVNRRAESLGLMLHELSVRVIEAGRLNVGDEFPTYDADGFNVGILRIAGDACDGD